MRQIFGNHPEIYQPFSADIISAKNEALMWKDAYYDCFEKLRALQGCKAYRIGNLLVRLFRR